MLKNFIAIEGIDGSGTTTQLGMLRERFPSGNFLFTAEPTSCETGKFLRRMLRGEVAVTNETAAYLFAADRNEHVNGALDADGIELRTGIRKACESGKIVVSDRYLFSSLAYQSVSCDPRIPRALNSFFPLPQILFFLEIDAAKSLERVRGRGQTEIYEKISFLSETQENYRRVMAEYEESSAETGMKVVRIDATLSPVEIHERIMAEISSLEAAKSP